MEKRSRPETIDAPLFGTLRTKEEEVDDIEEKALKRTIAGMLTNIEKVSENIDVRLDNQEVPLTVGELKEVSMTLSSLSASLKMLIWMR